MYKFSISMYLDLSIYLYLCALTQIWKYEKSKHRNHFFPRKVNKCLSTLKTFIEVMSAF